jgi:hypothetical protein
VGLRHTTASRAERLPSGDASAWREAHRIRAGSCRRARSFGPAVSRIDRGDIDTTGGEHPPVVYPMGLHRHPARSGAWWVVWAVLVVVSMASAVNLTDGLDGLASGSATFCFSVWE